MSQQSKPELGLLAALNRIETIAANDACACPEMGAIISECQMAEQDATKSDLEDEARVERVNASSICAKCGSVTIGPAALYKGVCAPCHNNRATESSLAPVPTHYHPSHALAKNLRNECNQRKHDHAAGSNGCPFWRAAHIIEAITYDKFEALDNA